MAVGDTNLQSCTVKASISAVLNKELDLSTPDDALSITKSVKLSDGTGIESGDQLWSDTRTLTTGASETLDLYGVLANAFGDTVNFNAVRVMLVVNNSTTDSLLVGGAASNAWEPFVSGAGDIVKIAPSSTNYPAIFLMTAPNATGFNVSSGTADQLKIAHSGDTSTSLTYDIVLIGESA